MTRIKRIFPALAIAQDRVARLQVIDPALDFGGGISIAAYQEKIATIQAKLAEYNTLLGEIDKLDLDLDKAEAELKSYSGKILTSVRGRYGRTSWEYGQAGGNNTVTKRKKSEDAEPDTIDLTELEMPEAKDKATANGLN